MNARRRRLGLLASATGLVLLLLGGYEAAGLRARLSPSSLLIGAQSVVASVDGRVFVGSNLSRVHVYSAEGKPLYGFEVEGTDFELLVEGADRLRIARSDGTSGFVNLQGEPIPASPPVASPPPADTGLRIDGGDVVRITDGARRVLVRGYSSHDHMLFHTLAVGVALFAGGLLLVGGMLATGRRSSP